MKEDVAFPVLRTPLELSKSCLDLNMSVKLQITCSVPEVVLFRLILIKESLGSDSGPVCVRGINVRLQRPVLSHS